MARRTPRQGQLGVQQETSRAVSNYTAPTFNRAAGSELFDLARGFAGLSQGLGAVIGAQQRNETLAARAMEENRSARMKQTRQQFEDAKKAEEDQKKRDEAERKLVNKEAAAFMKEAEIMREAGTSEADIDQYLRGHGGDTLNRAYTEWRKENQGNYVSFLGELREPATVIEFNRLQGENAARTLYAEYSEDIKGRAADLFMDSAAEGLSDADVMAALSIDEGLMSLHDELESRGLNAAQSATAITDLRAMLSKDLEDARTVAVKAQKREITHGRGQRAYNAAGAIQSNDIMVRAQAVRDMRSTVETILTGPTGPEQLDELLKFTDTYFDRLENDLAVGNITPGQMQTAVLNYEQAMMNTNTKKSILANYPEVQARMYTAKEVAFHTPEEEPEERFDRRVDTVLDGRGMRVRYKMDSSDISERKQSLADDRAVVEDLLRNPAASVTAKQQETLTALNPKLQFDLIEAEEGKDPTFVLNAGSSEELDYLFEAMVQQGQALEKETATDRTNRRAAVEDAEQYLRAELQTNPAIRNSYAARREYAQDIADFRNASPILREAAENVLKDLSNYSRELERAVENAVARNRTNPGLEKQVESMVMEEALSSPDWRELDLNSITRDMNKEIKDARGRTELSEPEPVSSIPIQYTVKITKTPEGGTRETFDASGSTVEQDSLDGTLSAEELKAVRVAEFGQEKAADALKRFQEDNIITFDLYRWKEILDDLASPEALGYDWLEILKVNAQPPPDEKSADSGGSDK